MASPAFSLQPAFPNPFETETRIPFILGEEMFGEREGIEVTMRVYNLLHQPVAVPRLRGQDGRPGRRLDALRFTRPGVYEAVWDGTDREGGRVTPGPYFVQMVVDGRSQVRKLLMAQ